MTSSSSRARPALTHPATRWRRAARSGMLEQVTAPIDDARSAGALRRPCDRAPTTCRRRDVARRGRPPARADGRRAVGVGRRAGRDWHRLLRLDANSRLGRASSTRMRRLRTASSARFSSATCSGTPPPTAATWARTCGGRGSSSTTGSRSSGSRAGRPTGTPGFPVGQYYFPLPAVMVAVLDHVPFVPYNVAFKLVTVSGPLMLPAAAYYFATGHARAVAGRRPRSRSPRSGMLDADAHRLEDLRRQHREHARRRVLVRDRARARAVRPRRARVHARHRQATMAAGGADRAPRSCRTSSSRSSSRSAALAALAVRAARAARGRSRSPSAPSACCSPRCGRVPLLGNQAYTQSMRYTKLVPKGSFDDAAYVAAAARTRCSTRSNGIVARAGAAAPTRRTQQASCSPPLWLPWWIWVLAGVAIVAAGWYRRRSTLVLL